MTDKRVRTTCPYCGVGCGVLASLDEAGRLSIQGDPHHPANHGRLCSKGITLGETVGLEGRLLYPQVDGRRVGWEEAFNAVAEGLSRVVQAHGPDAVAFFASGQLLTEDYYVANKLMKGYIGSANIDTNSRLCMSSPVVAHKRAFGADAVPCAYEDLERAKLIVLAGSNTAWCHPVLYQRIVEARRDNPDLLVVVIDPRRTATCAVADLHLALQPGTDAVLFNGLLAYLHRHGEENTLFTGQCTEGMDAALSAAAESAPGIAAVAQRCGLVEEDVTRFYRLFARTERVVSVFSQGVNQSSSGVDKINAIINCHLLTGRIGRPGMGPFSFTGQPNAMGGREVGGLANQLAAHMAIGDPHHRERVQRFWGSPVIAEREGLKAVDLFQAVGEGRIKALWIMGTNPAVSLPDADRVRDALARCDFVVVSDCMRHTDTTDLADVLLPVRTWGERDGTVTNSERRISRQRPFLPAPGEACPDWWIICQVARRMGFTEGFGYRTAHEIFREHAALSGFENEGERAFDISALNTLDGKAYDDLEPFQWPLDKGRAGGTARLFTDGRFFTPGGRARFVPIIPRPPGHPVDDDFPYVINTGRVRDQWHTMTRTGKASRLTEHSPEPYVEIHPGDAMDAGVTEGALARVFSRWGEVIVRVKVSDRQRRGSLFLPMHWNSQFSSHGRVDALVNPVVDPLSGQPESKYTPGRVVPYNPAWHGFLLSRRRLDLKEAGYWVRATGEGFYRYELAGEQSPADWPVWARRLLCTADNDVNWVEYLDIAARRYRGVRLLGERLESCIFIAPQHALPSRSWLASLFAKEALSEDERAHLLTGQPAKGVSEAGPVVCACFGVGLNTLRRAIEEDGLDSVAAIGAALKAGTNCGSCIPELRALIAGS